MFSRHSLSSKHFGEPRCLHAFMQLVSRYQELNKFFVGASLAQWGKADALTRRQQRVFVLKLSCLRARGSNSSAGPSLVLPSKSVDH